MQTQSNSLGQPTENWRAKADGLRKAKSYAEAAEAYAKVWPDNDQWTGWGYAHCLRKAKRSTEALAVCEELLVLAPDFEMAWAVYSWAVLDWLRGETEINEQVASRARRVVQLNKNLQNAYDAVNPFAPLILRVARMLLKKGRFKQTLRWLDQLDPVRLRVDVPEYTDAKGKTRKGASHRETFHSLKTNALEKEGRWEECLVASEFALALGLPGGLHYDNDLWFARRVALSKFHLGRLDEALTELTVLAARKPTSFLFYDLAEIAWSKKDDALTFKHCIAALQCFGEIAFKLSALLLLSKVLWAQGKEDYARQHLALFVAYRREHGWRLDERVMTLVTEWHVPLEGANAAELLKQLKSLWREWDLPTTSRLTGVVQTVMPHGRAGFIMAADHERFFFDTRDWKDKRGKPTTGAKVSFATKPSFDRKRQRASVVACDIRNT